MTSIYLIRHGQASFGEANYDCLSDIGKQQAAHIGQSFKSRVAQFDKVVCGTMQRHQQTASAFLDSYGQPEIPQQLNAAWNEYDHQDILAQLNPKLATAAGVKAYVGQQDNPHQSLQKIIMQAFERWIGSQHNQDYIESWPSYQARVQSALNDLLDNLSNEKNVMVFSSGGPIALLSQAILGVPAKQLMTLNWTLVNCGVTKLIRSKQGVVLSSLNEHHGFEGQHKALLTYK